MLALPVLRTPRRAFIPLLLAAVLLGWNSLWGWLLAPLILALLLLYRAFHFEPGDGFDTIWDGIFLAVYGWLLLLTFRLGVAIIQGVSPLTWFEWLSRSALDHPVRMVPLLLLPMLAVHDFLRHQAAQFDAWETRFTFDLMPSMQMEVDDHIVWGQCCADEARRRRSQIEREGELLVAASFHTRVIFTLNGLAVSAALLCLFAGVAWRGLSQGSTAELALVACGPAAVALALVLPLSNLLFCLAAGVSLFFRSTLREKWESISVPPSKRPPWLWCLVGLLGWYDLQGLMLALLALCGLLLLAHLRKQDPENPLDEPFPVWHRAAFVVHSWQVIFLCCATLAFLFSTSQARILEQLGGMLLDNHPRLLPLLCLPLLLAHSRIQDQAKRIGDWSEKFRQDGVPGIQMAIEADRLYGKLSREMATISRERLEQEADMLDWVAVQMKRTRRISQLSLLAVGASLLGGIAWRCLLLGQDFAWAWSARAGTLMAAALILTTSSLLFTTALELRLASPFRFLERSATAPLAERREVGKTVGGVVAEICLAWLGLPLGLSLASYTLWRCRTQAPSPQHRPSPHRSEGNPRYLFPRPTLEVAVGGALETIRLEVGRGLRPLIDSALRGNLLAAYPPKHTMPHMGWGMRLPVVHVRDHPGLPSGDFRIYLGGQLALETSLLKNRFLAHGPEAKLKVLKGLKAGESLHGMPSLWIASEDRDLARQLGLRVLDADEAFRFTLAECLLRHAHLWLDHTYLADFEYLYIRAYPWFDSNCQAKSRLFMAVLKTLLDEQVWLDEMEIVMKTFHEFYDKRQAACCEHLEFLVEKIRLALAPNICRQHADPSGELNVLAVNLPPEDDTEATLQLLAIMKKQLVILEDLGVPAVAVTQAQDRSRLRRLTRLHFPDLVVLSQDEVVLNLNILAESQVA